MPSSDGYEALVSVVLGKGFPFYGRRGLQRPADPPRVSGVDDMELDNGQPVRSRWRERDAEEDGRVASRRRMVVTLKGWGPTVRRIDRDGEKNEKSLRY
jgi:hypothetical protein